MRCTRPGAVTPEDLFAYIDGEASGEVTDHIRDCAVCTAEAQQYARAQRGLRRVLFRFDCPPPQTLGEYHLAIVSPEERQAIAAHVVDCPRCAEELTALRTFMAAAITEPTHSTGVVERLRQVVATLVAPPAGPAYAGLRGSVDEQVRTYVAGDVAITISFVPQIRRRLGTVVGLVTRQGPHAEMLAGRDVVLEDGAGVSYHAQIDDLGNFAFEDITFGTYRLEVRLVDEAVVVEDLRIGAR